MDKEFWKKIQDKDKDDIDFLKQVRKKVDNLATDLTFHRDNMNGRKEKLRAKNPNSKYKEKLDRRTFHIETLIDELETLISTFDLLIDDE